MIREIKRLFGIYEPGCEYWVRVDQIKVPIRYKITKVRKDRWLHKLDYWRKHGVFESKILLHRDFTLADGYSSLKLAYLNEIAKVPVYFID